MEGKVMARKPFTFGQLSPLATKYVGITKDCTDDVNTRVAQVQSARDQGDAETVQHLLKHHTRNATNALEVLRDAIVPRAMALIVHELEGHINDPRSEVVPPLLAEADLRRTVQHYTKSLYSRLAPVAVLCNEPTLRVCLEAVIESVAEISARVDKTHRRVIKGRREDYTDDHRHGPQRVQIQRLRANSTLLLPLRDVWDELEAAAQAIIDAGTMQHAKFGRAYFSDIND